MDATGHLYNGCLVVVPAVEAVYREFTATFKEKLGRIPHSGIPRISRMKPGTTRFTLTDVSGNSMIFVDAESEENDQETRAKAADKNKSTMQKAVAIAIPFLAYKDNDQGAASRKSVVKGKRVHNPTEQQ